MKHFIELNECIAGLETGIDYSIRYSKREVLLFKTKDPSETPSPMAGQVFFESNFNCTLDSQYKYVVMPLRISGITFLKESYEEKSFSMTGYDLKIFQEGLSKIPTTTDRILIEEYFEY